MNKIFFIGGLYPLYTGTRLFLVSAKGKGNHQVKMIDVYGIIDNTFMERLYDEWRGYGSF